MMEAIMEDVKIARYSAYRDSGVEWIGEIPEHWEVIRGNYVFSTINERSKSGREQLLTVSEHKGVRLRSESNVNMFMAESYKGYKICYPGDLVINSLWAWSRGLGFSEYKGIVSTAYSVFRPKPSFNSTYLNYLLRIEKYVSQYLIASKGIWISRLQLSDWAFLRIPVIVPPLHEQTAIANFLDRKTEMIDKAIRIKEKQIELLKERRQILIHNAVTRGLDPDVELKDSGIDWIGQIPKHWEVRRLKYVAEQQNLKLISSKTNLPFIGMENIESWTGNYVKTNSEIEGLACYFNRGDILFGKLRPYLAKVFLAKSHGICSTEFLVLKNTSLTYNKYLYNCLLSYRFIEIINASTYGAKMPRANSSFILNQIIPLPVVDEQENISKFIEKNNRKFRILVSIKQKEIEKLKEYKASLINSAVTGKIKVNA